MSRTSNSKFSNSIYHYTKSTTALEYILPSRRLKLNSISLTNDPREKKEFSFDVFNSPAKNIKEYLKQNSELSRLIKKNVKVLCFSEDYKINNKWYEGLNLPRMWSQYAENHKGICLEIDKDLFIEENKESFKHWFGKSINYGDSNNSPSIDYDKIEEEGIESYIKSFQHKEMDFLFFRKFYDWEAEREYRIIHFSENTNNEFAKIEKSLKRIILGIDFNEIYLPTLIKLANKTKISIISSEHGELQAFDYLQEYLDDVMKISN